MNVAATLTTKTTTKSKTIQKKKKSPLYEVYGAAAVITWSW